tara:strand:- start:62 stop:241 length:180 start_codon:yes stop_codon:yes gene_type:complete
MNNFLFHGLEFLTTDSILITGTIGGKSIEIVVDEAGVNVLYNDKVPSSILWNALKEEEE